MIFYFSATGNCRYVAERAAAATGERCVSITACMQAGELAFTPRDGEMVGIVSPVYFWGLPSIHIISALTAKVNDRIAGI